MKVLNLFGYTGGFSVYAGANGAKEITTVDSAKPAIKGAEKNFRVNNLSASNHQLSTDDAYSFLERAVAQQKTWDLIIVDPPAFIQNTTQLEAGGKAYSHLFTQALKTLKVGGVIAFASCSGRFLPEEFQNTINLALKRTKKRGIVIANRGLPADHPFPFECKELGYLKFMLLRCF
jgi:23S rRNA (cytosine1962-C5)-methyltransferase